MSYNVVIEQRPQPDGLGGNRTLLEYESENEFQNVTPDEPYFVVACDISLDEAEKLLCQTPDICVALSTLDEMFDPKTENILSREKVKEVISKAVKLVNQNHDYQREYGVEPTCTIPENLKNLGFYSSNDTDKMYTFKALRLQYPVGMICDDLGYFLNKLVRIFLDHRFPQK
jgi:hypothetical protein